MRLPLSLGNAVESGAQAQNIKFKGCEKMLNQIIHGDCLEGMKFIQNGFIDLTVTSPPYDGLRNYNGYSFNFEGVAKELFRITKDGGVVVWVVGDSTTKGSETLTSFHQAIFFKSIGFNLHDTMIYEKQNPTPMVGGRYQQCFEYMFIFSKGKPKTFNPIKIKKKYMENRKNKKYNKDVDGETIQHEYKANSDMKVVHNIWRYTVGLNNSTKDKEAFKHPAIFPEKLAEDHILSWSNEGDIVFDPFMGSGTTAKMAIANKRDYIGFEISSDYIEIANKRLKNIFCCSECGSLEMIWMSDFQEEDKIESYYSCALCDEELILVKGA